ncbi:MAG: hypothetical protein WC738_02260 [Candidatus Omnitrophota bacterium]|jgi:hypothetical protein
MLKNIILIVISLILFFALLETGAAIYIKLSSTKLAPLTEDFAETPDSPHLFDREVGYRLKPVYSDKNIKTNSMGFRSSRDFDFKDAQRKRVMILGDSMAFGYRLEQKNVFSEILNDKNIGFDFVNTSVIGYTTAQEYLTLKKYIDIIKPEIIILFYYQANDIWENCRNDCFHPKAYLSNGRLAIAGVKKHSGTAFYKRSNFYRLLDKRILQGMDLQYFIQRLDFGIRGKNSVVWKTMREILSEIGGIARRRNIKVIVIDIPTINQVKKPSGSRARQNLLVKACEEEKFLYYDLLLYYPDDRKELFCDWKYDAHWNKNGQQFIASFIEKIFSENKLLHGKHENK